MVRTKRPQWAPAAWRRGASNGTATVVARSAVMRSGFMPARAPERRRSSVGLRSFEQIRLFRVLVLDVAEHLAKMGAHHGLGLRRIAGADRLRDCRVLLDQQGEVARLGQAEITHAVELELDVLDEAPTALLVDALAERVVEGLVELEKAIEVLLAGGRPLVRQQLFQPRED